jgi:hypothetical protein
MAQLHRTLVHHEALGLVRDARIVWREAVRGEEKDGVARPPAGFSFRDGDRIAAATLVALWEMRHAHLIAVMDGHLTLTPAGWDRLSEWDETKQRTN